MSRVWEVWFFFFKVGGACLKVGQGNQNFHCNGYSEAGWGGLSRLRTTGMYVGQHGPHCSYISPGNLVFKIALLLTNCLTHVSTRNSKIYVKAQISNPSTAMSFCAITSITISLDLPTSTGYSTPNLCHCQGNIEVEYNKHWYIYRLSSDEWSYCCDTESPLPHGCLQVIRFL